MTEDIELRRKRLRFRSTHRGTKELDLVFGAFAERHLDAMSAGQIARYEAILDADEYDIYRWLTAQAAIPSEHDNDVMAQILSFEFAKTKP